MNNNMMNSKIDISELDVVKGFPQGSLAWGTHDSGSDVDSISIVNTTLNFMVFNNLSKRFVFSGEESCTYITEDEFIKRVMLGNINSLLFLGSYFRYIDIMGVGKITGIDVLDTFKETDNMETYLKYNMDRLMLSAYYMANNIISPSVNGKQFIQFLTSIVMVERLLEINNTNMVGDKFKYPNDLIDVSTEKVIYDNMRYNRETDPKVLKNVLGNFFDCDDVTDYVIVDYMRKLKKRVINSLYSTQDIRKEYREKYDMLYNDITSKFIQLKIESEV